MEILTVTEVAKRLKVSRQTIYKWMANHPDFPRPIRLGSRTARWRASDLDAYLESLDPAASEYLNSRGATVPDAVAA